MAVGSEYAARVRAWAGELRAGSTRTWAEFLAAPAPASIAAGPIGDDVPLPSATHLELVRRLAALDLPQFPLLADVVLGTAGGGRGLVDVPLPWPDRANRKGRIGTPPTQPDQLPADEVLRVCAAVLTRLLAEEPGEPRRSVPRRWRPWRRGFTLLGAPGAVASVRAALLDRGLREGGARTTYFVLGGPLEDLMAQRWSARVHAGAGMKWARMWRTAAAYDRVPPGIDLPALAGRLADEFTPGRVHVVVAPDAASTLGVVADVLGVTSGHVDARHDVLATDLLRRVNPLLALAVGEERRRDVVDRVWPQVADGEDSGPLAAPAPQLDWAVAAGERMGGALRGGRYAVHGDPALVVPTRRPGVPRAPDPDAVLGHALEVIGRAWRRTVERQA